MARWVFHKGPRAGHQQHQGVGVVHRAAAAGSLNSPAAAAAGRHASAQQQVSPRVGRLGEGLTVHQSSCCCSASAACQPVPTPPGCLVPMPSGSARLSIPGRATQSPPAVLCLGVPSVRGALDGPTSAFQVVPGTSGSSTHSRGRCTESSTSLLREGPSLSHRRPHGERPWYALLCPP